jgi:hypothetical protein
VYAALYINKGVGKFDVDSISVINFPASLAVDGEGPGAEVNYAHE